MPFSTIIYILNNTRHIIFYPFTMIAFYLTNKCLSAQIRDTARCDEKRLSYISTNISKGIFLSLITSIFVYFRMKHNFQLSDIKTWDMHYETLLKNVICIYTSTDIVGLFINKKMERSTIVHHVCVFVTQCILNLIPINTAIFGSFLGFGAFSSMSFIVNLYLGLRFFYKVNGLKCTSAIIYALSISCNMKYQYNILKRASLYESFVIVPFLAMWFYDDFKLLRFLLR